MDTASSSERTHLSVLGLDPELAAICVSCGLCLPHCPTFRVTGEERYSPRGRIDAMRAVDSGELPIDDEFVDFVETCVQCRGCEPACPSGVQFGALMEQTRTVLATEGRITPWWQRLGLWQGLSALALAACLVMSVMLIDRGGIALDASVPLPRPRSRTAPGFAELEERVLRHLISEQTA